MKPITNGMKLRRAAITACARTVCFLTVFIDTIEFESKEECVKKEELKYQA